MKLSSIVERVLTPYRKAIEEEKAFARNVINKIKKYGYTSILAGGAPRNWFFKRRARDFDIYINGKMNVEDFLKKYYGINIQDLDNNGEGKSYTGYDAKVKVIDDVVTFTYMGNTCQLISMEYKEECKNNILKFSNYVMKYFDFNINKVYYHPLLSGTGIRPYMSAFKDYENKTLTLSNEDAFSPERLEKMQEYFPDHEVVGVKEAIKEMA